jgi:hypothetical protein
MKRKHLWIAVAAVCGSLATGTFSTTALAADKPMPALTGWNLGNAKTVNGTSPDGRTWIYPSQAARDADVNNDGTGSTGFVIWELDDASGLAPGIQVLNDQPLTGDDAWELRNCIMASGGPDKVCGNDPGSSKRFKLRVTGSQTEPVDLVFDVADNQPFSYEDGVVPGDITGRIYRVLMKWANFTSDRVQGFKVEVGFGTGKDFKPASGTEGIAFELSPTVTRASLGDFVTGSEPTTREVWKPLEFATFSPGMYNPDDVLTIEDESGFFGDQVAGLIPPQDVDTVNGQYIYSGELQVNGIVGATTANYFGQWGYLLNEAQLPTGYYQDDDGDAATEGFLIAWLDTSVTPAVWKYSDGTPVPPATLDEWAAAPLSEEEVLLPLPRYEQAPIDDLAGLNVDVYLKLAETYDPAVSGDKVTLRLTPVAPGDSITPVPPPVVDGDGGGGCAIGGDGRFDPTLPALAAAGLVFFGLRRFKASK